MIQTQEVKQIARTSPGVAVPMWVSTTKHLKAWTNISPEVMPWQRTPTNATPI
jgi:hypothetical protein